MGVIFRISSFLPIDVMVLLCTSKFTAKSNKYLILSKIRWTLLAANRMGWLVNSKINSLLM